MTSSKSVFQTQIELEEHYYISANDFVKMCTRRWGLKHTPTLESVKAHKQGDALLKVVNQESGRIEVYFLKEYWMHRFELPSGVTGKRTQELIMTNMQASEEALNALPNYLNSK